MVYNFDGNNVTPSSQGEANAGVGSDDIVIHTYEDFNYEDDFEPIKKITPFHSRRFSRGKNSNNSFNVDSSYQQSFVNAVNEIPTEQPFANQSAQAPAAQSFTAPVSEVPVQQPFANQVPQNAAPQDNPFIFSIDGNAEPQQNNYTAPVVNQTPNFNEPVSSLASQPQQNDAYSYSLGDAPTPVATPAPSFAQPEPQPAPSFVQPEPQPAPVFTSVEPKPFVQPQQNDEYSYSLGDAPTPVATPAPSFTQPEPQPAPSFTQPEPHPAPVFTSVEPKPEVQPAVSQALQPQADSHDEYSYSLGDMPEPAPVATPITEDKQESVFSFSLDNDTTTVSDAGFDSSKDIEENPFKFDAANDSSQVFDFSSAPAAETNATPVEEVQSEPEDMPIVYDDSSEGPSDFTFDDTIPSGGEVSSATADEAPLEKTFSFDTSSDSIETVHTFDLDNDSSFTTPVSEEKTEPSSSETVMNFDTPDTASYDYQLPPEDDTLSTNSPVSSGSSSVFSFDSGEDTTNEAVSSDAGKTDSALDTVPTFEETKTDTVSEAAPSNDSYSYSLDFGSDDSAPSESTDTYSYSSEPVQTAATETNTVSADADKSDYSFLSEDSSFTSDAESSTDFAAETEKPADVTEPVVPTESTDATASDISDAESEQLLSQIEAFKNNAKMLSTLISQKQKEVLDLEEAVNQKDDQNKALAESLEKAKQDSANLEKQLDDHVNQLADSLESSIIVMKTDFLSARENADERLLAQLDKSNGSIERVKSDIGDIIHRENVEQYRNLQKLIVESNATEDLANSIKDATKGLEQKLTITLLLTVINFIGIIGLFLKLLGIF